MEDTTLEDRDAEIREIWQTAVVGLGVDTVNSTAERVRRIRDLLRANGNWGAQAEFASKFGQMAEYELQDYLKKQGTPSLLLLSIKAYTAKLWKYSVFINEEILSRADFVSKKGMRRTEISVRIRLAMAFEITGLLEEALEQQYTIKGLEPINKKANEDAIKRLEEKIAELNG